MGGEVKKMPEQSAQWYVNEYERILGEYEMRELEAERELLDRRIETAKMRNQLKAAIRRRDEEERKKNR